jgi:hypothetical protein
LPLEVQARLRIELPLPFIIVGVVDGGVPSGAVSPGKAIAMGHHLPLLDHGIEGSRWRCRALPNHLAAHPGFPPDAIPWFLTTFPCLLTQGG